MKEGILFTGGFSGDKFVSQCWLLSTSAYQWTRVPDLNTVPSRHASMIVEGQPYVIAGEMGDGKEMSSVESLQRFSGKWDSLTDLPKGLIHPIAVRHGQYIYVFGGGDLQGKFSELVFVYDTNSK